MMLADEALDCPMDSFYPYLPSLSAGPPWRPELRQEPGAVVPHAGTGVGGAGQPASLPRPRIHKWRIRNTKGRIPVRNPNPCYQPIPWLFNDFWAGS
jgi:hypothetical protein